MKTALEATIRSKVHCASVNVQAKASTYLWACALWTQQSRQATGLHNNAPASALSAATSFLSHPGLPDLLPEKPSENSAHWPCFITVVSGADSGSQHQHFLPLVLKAHLSPHVLQWMIQTLLDVYEGYLTRNSADFTGSLIITFVASFTKSVWVTPVFPRSRESWTTPLLGKCSVWVGGRFLGSNSSPSIHRLCDSI